MRALTLTHCPRVTAAARRARADTARPPRRPRVVRLVSVGMKLIGPPPVPPAVALPPGPVVGVPIGPWGSGARKRPAAARVATDRLHALRARARAVQAPLTLPWEPTPALRAVPPPPPLGPLPISRCQGLSRCARLPRGTSLLRSSSGRAIGRRREWPRWPLPTVVLGTSSTPMRAEQVSVTVVNWLNDGGGCLPWSPSTCKIIRRPLGLPCLLAGLLRGAMRALPASGPKMPRREGRCLTPFRVMLRRW